MGGAVRPRDSHPEPLRHDILASANSLFRRRRSNFGEIVFVVSISIRFFVGDLPVEWVGNTTGD